MSRRTSTRAWRLVRAGKSMPDPQSVTARAQTFAAAARDFHHVTMLTVGTQSGVTGYLITPDQPGADRAALNLAHAVSARAETVDGIPDLSGTRKVGVMRADVRAAAGRSTQSGADPAETARRVEMAMRTALDDEAPSWLAASIRRPTKGEVKRTRRWYAHRLGSASPTHHVMDNQAVTVTFTSGGDDSQEVRQRLHQVAAALPGFDVDVKVRIQRPWLSALPLLLLGAAAGVGLHFLHQPLLYSLGCAVLGVLLAAAVLTGVLPTEARSIVVRSRAGVFAAPHRKFGRTAKPQKARQNDDGGTDAKPGDYPLARDVFLVGPAILVGLVAPHAGAASGSAVTERKSASAAMLDPSIGPFVGSAGDGEAKVFISAADLSTGLAAIGRPNSGKSQIVRSLFAWNCLERRQPSGRPGCTGSSNALIAFESKGDGALVYQRWARACGDKTLLIEVADPQTYAIDIFDLPGTLHERVRLFANMLVYAFETGAIQGQSFESLELALSGALVTTDTIATQAEVATGRSPIFYAYLLLGGHGDDKGKALAAAISEAAARAQKAGDPNAADLIHADDQLAKVYGSKVTESSRRTQTQAARNKLSDMLAAESWWSPKRPKVTWRRILSEHRSVVINTGVSTKGHQMDERLSGYMASLLTYSMVETVKRTCSGWQDAGRSVSIFSDELSQMAGASTETMTWLHDQGRSYGVRPYLATQRLQQLPNELRGSLMDYSTVLWFSQSNTDAAGAAVLDLSADGSEWSNADITGLEPYTAVVRAYVRQVRQPAVPVRLAYFESDMDSFAAAQGYQPPTPSMQKPAR